MPFTKVDAPLIELLQDKVAGDITIPAFSRRAILTGASNSLLSLAPALTMVGNLLTIPAPVRNYDLTAFAGIGLSIETTVAAGNAPVVATRDVQVYNVASTGHTYTYPATRKLGQLLVLAVTTAALTTISTPSGWSLVISTAGTEHRQAIYSRVITGLEPSTELLAFGTASGAVARTWMIDIGDAPVEAVAGVNDSAAGTSLDLGTISPTWSVAEATSNLYLAVLGLANDLVVSGFPAGYTVTGQDVSASATANIDCTLAYAERSSLGSSENPGPFTYPASRAIAHVIAIKPKVTARLNWDGLAVRKAGSLVGTRRAVNFIDGTNATVTVADNVGTGAVDITINSLGHVIRDDGVGMTQRAALNFTTSTTLLAVLTDDAGNGETEIAYQLRGFTGGDISSSDNSLALTIVNNAVTNAKFRQSVAFSVVGRAGNTTGNVADITASVAGQILKLNNAGTSLLFGEVSTAGLEDDAVTNPKLAEMAANTIKANATAALANPTDFAVSAESVVGRTSGNITNITSAAQTALIRSGGSLFFASAAADQVLRRSGSGDLGFGTLVTNNIGDDQVTFAKTQNIATDRFLGRITAASGNIEELTPAQATSMLDIFTTSLQGVVPASGGGTTNFLRADGTWASPPGSVPGHQLRNNGVLMTQRGFINFLTSPSIAFLTTDDAVNNESEVIWHVDTSNTFSWTGSHTWNSPGFNVTTVNSVAFDPGNLFRVDAASSVRLAGAGMSLTTGLATQVPSGLDMVLNAIGGGIAINAHGTTPSLSVTNGHVEIDASVRAIMRSAGFIQLEAGNDAWLSSLGSGVGLFALSAGHPTGVTNGFCAIEVDQNLRIVCGGTERFEIVGSTGAWQVGGDTGALGDLLNSNGSASPPTWKPPGAYSVITPSVLTANVNNYNPTGWATANVVRLGTDGTIATTWDITGALAGIDGEIKYLVNLGPGDIRLQHENASSTAANRFLFASLTTFTLDIHDMLGIWYDGTSDRWRAMWGLSTS